MFMFVDETCMCMSCVLPSLSIHLTVLFSSPSRLRPFSHPCVDISPYIQPPSPAPSFTLLLHLHRQPFPELTPRLLIRRHALHARLPRALNHNPPLALRRPDRVPRRRASLLVRVRVQHPHKTQPVVHHEWDVRRVGRLVRGPRSAASVAVRAPHRRDFEGMRDTKTLCSVCGVDDVVAVGPGGFGVSILGEAARDKKARAVEGGFAIGVGGGVEVGVVCDNRGILAERILGVDGVGVCGGKLGIVVLEEG